MNEAQEIFEHLIALRAVLLGERRNDLARSVENILAILDEGRAGSFSETQGAWAAMMNFPRGLPDFGVWREKQEDRLCLNAELDRHLTSDHSGLWRMTPSPPQTDIRASDRPNDR